MAIDDNKQASKVNFAHDSVNGISNLAPSNLFKKSFNGVGALQPQPLVNQTAQSTSTTTAPSQTPATSNQKK